MFKDFSDDEIPYEQLIDDEEVKLDLIEEIKYQKETLEDHDEDELPPLSLPNPFEKIKPSGTPI